MSTLAQQSTSIPAERDESSDTLAPLLSEMPRFAQGERGFEGKRHLPYRRPTESHRDNNRVSSLPETVPPFKMTPDQQSARAFSASASLAGRQVFKSARSDYSIDSIVSSYMDSSVSVSASSYSRSSSGSYPAYESVNSPPSSPESVLIINDGEDSTLPGDFRKGEARDGLMVEDEGKLLHIRRIALLTNLYAYRWMGFLEELSTSPDSRPSWPSIPSLCAMPFVSYFSPPHYMRLLTRSYSGAEGTVIQGDDYSRMIWGLQTSSTKRPSNNVPNPRENVQRVEKKPARQTYEDLDKLRSPIELPGNPLLQSLPRETIGSKQTYSPYLDYERLARTHSPQVPDNIYQLHSPVSDVDTHVHPSNTAGAFLKPSPPFDGRRSMSSLDDAKPSTLKSSAPIFVPTNRPSQLNHSYSESMREDNRAIKPVSNRLRGRTSLPTPPSSSESLWTPVFSSHAAAPPLSSKAMSLLREIEHAAISQEESEQLRELVFRELGGMHLDDHRSSAPSTRRVSLDAGDIPRPLRDPHGPPPSTYASNYDVDGVVFPPTPPMADEAQLPGRSKEPRSVPFARMMERRRKATDENTKFDDVAVPPMNPQPVRRPSLGLEPIEPIHASLHPRHSDQKLRDTSNVSVTRPASPANTERKQASGRRSAQGQDLRDASKSAEVPSSNWNTVKKKGRSGKTTRSKRSNAATADGIAKNVSS